MKTKIILLVLFSILMAGVGYAEKECSTNLAVMPCNMTATNFSIYTGTYYCPADDCFTINSSNPPAYINLNGSTLYVNDSVKDGGLKLKANNILLDCQGGTIIGNTTGWGIAGITGYLNTSVQNCNIYNFSSGITLASGNDRSFFKNNIFKGNGSGTAINSYTRQNITLQNNTVYAFTRGAIVDGKGSSVLNNNFYNVTSYGLDNSGDVGGCVNLTVSGNYIYGLTALIGSGTVGIYSYCNSSIIFNNTIEHCMDGVQLYYGINSSVYQNYINNATDKGIRTLYSWYAKIYNNTILWSRNGIDENGYSTEGYYNLIKYSTHSGLDFANDANGYNSPNNSIYHDNIIRDSTFSLGNLAGIYIDGARGLHIYNNTITNISALNNDTSQVSGIKIDNNRTLTFDNIIEYNTISDIYSTTVNGFCFAGSGTSNNFTNNIFSNCGNIYAVLKNWYDANDRSCDYTLKDNSVTNMPIVQWQIERPIYNALFNINESFSMNGFVNLSNNGTLYFLFSGRKDIKVVNNTVTINAFVSPYNDIYDVTNKLVLAKDQTTYSMTLSPNQEVWVTDCVGEVGDNFCSELEMFNNNVKPNLVTSYLVFASMMSLIVIIAMIGGIVFLIFQFKSGRLEFNFENLSIYLKGGAFLLIIATFVIIVTVILITVGANILG